MSCTFSKISSQPIAHHHLAVCGSTNDVLMQNLTEHKVDNAQPYLLTASMQTSGRGQRNRTWQSPIGNIYLSLYHPLPTAISGLLSLVVGFHITRLPILQQLNRQRHALSLPKIGVKWANDIGYYQQDKPTNPSSLSHKSFKKLAGILIEPVVIEGKLTGIIIGVGINIEAAPVLCDTTKEGMDYEAISLTQIIHETQQAYQEQNAAPGNNTPHSPASALYNNASYPTAADLYQPVSATILRAIQQFIAFADNSYSQPTFLKEYQAVNVLLGQQVQITQSLKSQAVCTGIEIEKPPVVTGEVLGLNEDGSLQLRNAENDQLINIYTGTIRLLTQ